MSRDVGEKAVAQIAAPPGLPVVAELPTGLSAVEAFRRLRVLPHVVFFDSAAPQGELGRWSFVAADPFDWIESAEGDDRPLDRLAALAARFAHPRGEELPPFTGGLAGVLGYGLSRCFERVPAPQCDDLPTPAVAVGAYDVVMAFDHWRSRGWLVSQGWPAIDSAERRERARDRAAQFRQLLAGDDGSKRLVRAEVSEIAACDLAPQHAAELAGVVSNLTRDDYLTMVRRGVEYIHAGDVFQANLSQRLLAPQTQSAADLYLRLRERNPAPYAGFFDMGSTQVCSASPECFLTVRGDQAETRPIKGTRGRSRHPLADLFAGDDLRASAKDRAENVMIVDLLRNDLARSCTADSVRVDKLCELETYAHVKHLVSVVSGRLAPGRGPLDLLAAAFPGGSITGAPKVRAMEIIAELEPTARGPYCGSLAYLGFDGQMDSNILIRTITAAHGWLQAPVGGGIVAASDPAEEYRESWHKARGLADVMAGGVFEP
ncbi:MAG: anthranilate synthase component I family protein [Pirellulales bacterium]|nr:anthranilate synthase component I family protein [Pirellulales bacterium]